MFKKKRTVEILKTDHKMEIKMNHGDTENWSQNGGWRRVLMSVLLLLDWNAFTRPMVEVQGAIHTTFV